MELPNSKPNRVSDAAQINFSTASDVVVNESERSNLNNAHGLVSNDFSGRVRLLIALGFLLTIAGIRFSDGSLLLAIANGDSASSPAFNDPFTQYHWDQPLKVMLLRVLPANILVIAVVFLGLNLLPVSLALHPGDRALWLSSVTLLLTPAFKVVVQNIGAGDGLVVALILVAAIYQRLPVVAICYFLIGFWHPQQAFFIGLSGLLSIYVYREKPEWSHVIVIAGALALALIVYLAHRANLGFQYKGRGDFVTLHLKSYFSRNLIYAPIALAPVALWFFIAAPSTIRGSHLLVLWMMVLAGVSLIAMDVTRVMTIISLPIILAGAIKLEGESSIESNAKLWWLATLVAIIPVYSWSGLDAFLWNDLIKDFCKWTSLCFVSLI